MKALFFFSSAIVLMLACHEDTPPADSLASRSASGDTVIYYRHEPDVAYYELPVCNGTYDCPVKGCLSIDCSAGKLYSETASGIPYALTCINQNDSTTIVVMISGIRYPDSSVFKGTHAMIVPVYNGSTNVPKGSKIDTPPPGVSTARAQGLAVDTGTGIIDIDASVANGIFGSTPKKGAQKNFRIYYRLNDPSHFVLNYTDVLFTFDAADGTTTLRTLGRTTGCSTVNVK